MRQVGSATGTTHTLLQQLYYGLKELSGIFYMLQLTNSKISLPFVKELMFGDFVCYFTLYLDQKTLLLHSIFKQKHSTMCSCLHLFEFESHACHMPTKYHLIGGSRTKYSKHRWLLYTLGSVKKTHHM